MEIAHRIDRETSGVLLVARGRAAASFLTRAFARRAVDKTYLALVQGTTARRRAASTCRCVLLDTHVAHHDGRRARRRAARCPR